MKQQEKIKFKHKLKQFCYHMIEQRIQTSRSAIENAQQSANSEEKSSAGDKYETSRAMSHLERDMHSRQLSQNLKELSTLETIPADLLYDKVSTGAFIRCETISFFIAAGLGKQIMDGETILFLSPHAPVAKLLDGKKAGAQFYFNGKDTLIADVF